MTEILGGSDVRSSTTTTATLISNNKYSLHGLKWFTSAIDADISFTLAKIKHQNGEIDSAPTLFFLKVRDSKTGQLNNINVVRLKDKLGTRQLPTAELILEGTIAEIASPPKKGITLIMNLANITRLHNVTFSVAYIGRMIKLLESYSHKRKVFGKELSSQPLHIVEVAKMKFIYEGNLLFLLQIVKMHGKGERLGNKYKNKDMLRLLLPIAKLFAGRCSEEVCLEGINGFGGSGYMENSFIPQLLRDTIVTSIWEGSINLLSFDFIKVLQGDPKNFKMLMKKIMTKINLYKNENEKLSLLMKEIENVLLNENGKVLKDEKNARAFAFLLSALFIISLIIKYTENNDDNNSSSINRKDMILQFWISKARNYFMDLQSIDIFELSKLKNYVFKPKF